MSAETGRIIVEEVPHVCDESRECDEHKAQKWWEELSKAAPEIVAESAKHMFVTMMRLSRMAVVTSERVELYQKVLAVLARRNAGTIDIWDDELVKVSGSLTLDREGDKTIFTLREIPKKSPVS